MSNTTEKKKIGKNYTEDMEKQEGKVEGNNSYL